jgi:hypothetical protein
VGLLKGEKRCSASMRIQSRGDVILWTPHDAGDFP